MGEIHLLRRNRVRILRGVHLFPADRVDIVLRLATPQTASEAELEKHSGDGECDDGVGDDVQGSGQEDCSQGLGADDDQQDDESHEYHDRCQHATVATPLLRPPDGEEERDENDRDDGGGDRYRAEQACAEFGGRDVEVDEAGDDDREDDQGHEADDPDEPVGTGRCGVHENLSFLVVGMRSRAFFNAFLCLPSSG